MNFAKINTNELFKAVDFDNSGSITEDEWMAFWEIVKKSGHTEKEISEEVMHTHLKTHSEFLNWISRARSFTVG